jgi:hypothetical protein
MDGSRPARIWYFTLERTHPENGEIPTMFCAWAPNGEHLNFGNGPQPDRDAFLALIVSSQSQPPVLHGGSGPQGLRGADGKIMSEDEVRRIKEQAGQNF